MTTIFTDVGEFSRGKGNRAARLGPRTFTTTGGRQYKSPNQIQANKLFSLLENKPGLTKDDRYRYKELMLGAEQLRTMNMSVLAEVILFIHNSSWIINPTTFNSDTIDPYIERRTPSDLKPQEREIVRLRFQAEFMRYVFYVLELRNSSEEALEQAVEQQGFIPAAPSLT